MNETLSAICNDFCSNYKSIEEEEKRKIANDGFPWFWTILGIIGFIFIAFFIFLCIDGIIKTKKSKRVGTVTRIPIIPFTQEDFERFEEDQSRKLCIPEARIFCSSDLNSPYRNHAITRMCSIMRMALKIKEVSSASSHADKVRYNNPVPNDARLIAIRMDNFKHGIECHDFEPIDGISPGSCYTYQMFGDNRIQVTNYVENGITYVAGFCIYIERDSCAMNYREEFIKDFINSRKYIERRKRFELNKTNESENIIEKHSKKVPNPKRNGLLLQQNESTCNQTFSLEDASQVEEINEWTIKNCPRLQRLVMTGVTSRTIVHQEWDKYESQMKREKCQMCSEQIDKDSLPTYSSLSMV